MEPPIVEQAAAASPKRRRIVTKTENAPHAPPPQPRAPAFQDAIGMTSGLAFPIMFHTGPMPRVGIPAIRLPPVIPSQNKDVLAIEDISQQAPAEGIGVEGPSSAGGQWNPHALLTRSVPVSDKPPMQDADDQNDDAKAQCPGSSSVATVLPLPAESGFKPPRPQSEH